MRVSVSWGGESWIAQKVSKVDKKGLGHETKFFYGSTWCSGEASVCFNVCIKYFYCCELFNQNPDLDFLLSHNESYRALEAANALLKPGPTGTNVNDFRAIWISGAAGA